MSPGSWVGVAEIQEEGLEVALSQSKRRWDADTKYSGLGGKVASAIMGTGS